jgi:hypothetical protein
LGRVVVSDGFLAVSERFPAVSTVSVKTVS